MTLDPILARAATRTCTARRVTAFDRADTVRRLFAREQVYDDFRIVSHVAYPTAETWFDVATDGRELFISVIFWEGGEFTALSPPPPEPGVGNHSVEVVIAPCGDGLGFLQFGAGPGNDVWLNHHWPYRDGRPDLAAAPRWSVAYHCDAAADRARFVFFRFALDGVRLPGYTGAVGLNVMRTQLRTGENAAWNYAGGAGLPDATSCGWLLLGAAVAPPAPPRPTPAPAVKLYGIYDWPDEMVGGPYTPDVLRAELRFLKAHGMSRVYYQDYPQRESWGLDGAPLPARMAESYRVTNAAFGEDLMIATCRLAHEEGLEFYTICKPYDLGRGEAFVRAHPELCFRRNPAWTVPAPTAPLTDLTLYGDGDAPLAFDPAGLTLYASADNRTYAPVPGVVARDDVVERPRAACSPAGNQSLSGSDRVRRVRLSGFRLTTRYAAIVLPAATAAATPGGFGNREFLLVEAACPPGLHRSVRGGDFRTRGFDFVHDGSAACWADHSEGLTFRRALGAGSVLGLCFGHEPYHAPMLEPSHAAVRAFWLDHWVRRAIAAGADGLDVRIAHHHGCAEWLAYAYAEPVLAAFRARVGRAPAPTAADYAVIRRLRGEAHTQFLRDAKALLAAAGKRLEAHLEARMKTPPAHDTYTQIHWDWSTWIEAGIVDGINLKYLSPLSPFVQCEVLPRTRRAGIPVHCIGAIGDVRSQPRTPEWTVETLQQCRAGGVAALSLYELWGYCRTAPHGAWFTRGCARSVLAQLRDALA